MLHRPSYDNAMIMTFICLLASYFHFLLVLSVFVLLVETDFGVLIRQMCFIRVSVVYLSLVKFISFSVIRITGDCAMVAGLDWWGVERFLITDIQDRVFYAHFIKG